MGDDQRLVDIASAVAEGSAVDWEAAEQTAKDASERAVVKELQVLARMADAVRAPEATPPLPRPESRDQLRVGELWGHLRISEVIGEGSFGTVYRAWDQRLECEVALKLIKASGVSRAFDLARALREARHLARVQHRNVVRVFGADSHGERFGLWMEMVPGRTLEHVLAVQGRMGASEVIPIGLDLCHALAAVHGAGLLHRDLKARNVLREAGGRIVLMDFGTGRDVSRTDASDDLAGTPLYLAPELFTGAKPSRASDVYSLGVLLYHLVSGDYPVRGTTRSEVESAHRTGQRHPLRDARPDLPPAFVDVIERAIAPDPRARYQSAGQFGNALAAAAALPYTEDRAPTFAFKWPIVAAVSAVAVVMLAGLVLLNGGRGGGSASAAPEPAAGDGSPSTVTGGSAVPSTSSYKIRASFYASRDGRDIKLSQGGRVRPGDELFVVLDSSQPLYVYIINRDDVGKSYLLFPLPGLSPGNPLPGRGNARLPGVMDGERINWVVTTPGRQEHFLVYATPQRLVAFEQEYLDLLPRAELGRQVSALPLSTEAIATLRGVGGLTPASSSDSSTGPELASVLPLGEDSESANGVWVRRMSFQNPAE